MIEPNLQESTTAPATAEPNARKPFVRPAVQDAGGLQHITLLGGSL